MFLEWIGSGREGGVFISERSASDTVAQRGAVIAEMRKWQHPLMNAKRQGTVHTRRMQIGEFVNAKPLTGDLRQIFAHLCGEAKLHYVSSEKIRELAIPLFTLRTPSHY